MEEEYQYDVFLSHAGEDDPFVKKLADDLERLGTRVFEDERAIRAGENIMSALQKALGASRKFVFIMSPASLSKPWPQAEAQDILHADPTNSERLLIPILLKDCDPPAFIKQIKYIQ